MRPPSPACCMSWQCLPSAVLAGATSSRGSRSDKAHSESTVQPADKYGGSLLLPRFVSCAFEFEFSHTCYLALAGSKREEFLTALRSLSSGQPSPWLHLPFCLQPSLMPPSSCSVKYKPQGLGCLCAALPQRFCLSVCGLSLAQDRAEPGPHQRHFPAMPAEETLSLSMVCRLGPSNHTSSGGCFLK